MKLFVALCVSAVISITAAQENDCPDRAASYCSHIRCSLPDNYRPGCKMLLNSSQYRQTPHCVCIQTYNPHIWINYGEAYPGPATTVPCPPSSMGACAEDTICDSDQWEPTCLMIQESGIQSPRCVCRDRFDPNRWHIKGQAWEKKENWIACTERHAEFSRAYCESGIIDCGNDQWLPSCRMTNVERPSQEMWCVCVKWNNPRSWYKVQEALRKPDDGHWP